MEKISEFFLINMKLFVKAKPGMREEYVEKIDDTHFEVFVKEPPLKGRANDGIVRALAKHFAIAPSRVRIISGYTSRQKIIEIT